MLLHKEIIALVSFLAKVWIRTFSWSPDSSLTLLEPQKMPHCLWIFLWTDMFFQIYNPPWPWHYQIKLKFFLLTTRNKGWEFIAGHLLCLGWLWAHSYIMVHDSSMLNAELLQVSSHLLQGESVYIGSYCRVSDTLQIPFLIYFKVTVRVPVF